MSLPDSQRQAGPSSDFSTPNEVPHRELCGPVMQQRDELDPVYPSLFSTGVSHRLPDFFHSSQSYSLSYAEQPLLESTCSIDYHSYFPDVPALNKGMGVGLDNGFTCNLSPSSLSAWMESPDYDFLIIHSPKPVFAYKIFDFDFDRPCSPEDELPSPGLPNYPRKRRREPSDISEDSTTILKRRKMDDEVSRFISLPPDPHFSLSPLRFLQIPSTDIHPFTRFTVGKNTTFGCAFDFKFASSWPSALTC